MRTAWLTGLALALAVVGCDDGTVETDAGPTPGIDSGTPSGTDSGTPSGTDSGTPSGTDAGTPAIDAFVPMVDAGPPTCDMGRITILEDCGDFTACGGDPIGEWCYAEICIEKDELLDPAFEAGGAALADCEAARDEIVVRSSTGTVSGTVTVTETTITRAGLNVDATGEIYLPAACNPLNCRVTGGLIDQQLMNAGTGSAECDDDVDGGCLCTIMFESTLDETDNYTRDETAGTIETEDGRIYDYCVQDGQLRFRQDPEGGGDVIEPGLQLTLPSST